jgi:hypothetical protein
MKTYFPLFVLCMLLCTALNAQSPGVTASFDTRKNNVSIKWNHIDKSVNRYYLQRSGDNVTWTDLLLQDARSLPLNKIVKLTDNKPDAGKSHYRLKIIGSSGTTYSKSLVVIIGQQNSGWIMYPVPVSKTLNLQYNGTEMIPGVITVIIRTMRGQVLNNLRLASTTRLIQIPVDNLGRGTYDVQIVVKNQPVWNQRFIK